MDKQELSMGNLEEVNGGDTHESLEKMRFLFGKGLHVEVRTFEIPFIHQFTAGGDITGRGYTCTNGVYSPCYYVTCDDSDYSGWYDEDFIQDTTYTSWDKIDASTVTVVD